MNREQRRAARNSRIEMNEAPILDQMRENWQKIAALLLFRYTQPGEQVVITVADIEDMNKKWPIGSACAITGSAEAFTLKLVTPEENKRLMALQHTQEGHA